MDLVYRPFSQGDDLSSLDFTENDNSDPLEVNRFIHEKAQEYHINKLSTVWVVRSEGEIVACFTTSMSAISIEDLGAVERVEHATPRRYPATLLGQLGVDKKHRNKGIGKSICHFCVGLAQDIGDRIACRYVILQTNEDKTTLYERMGFTKSPKSPQNNKIWMYRRISQTA